MTSERALENNSLGAGPHNTAEPLELNKRSFFETLRTSEGHEKVEKYAQGCFCPELLLFLDAYVAFKGCIFNELKQEYTLNEPKTEQSTHTPKSIYKQPAIHVINFHGNASQISSEVKSTEERASHASTRKQSMDDIAESAVSPPTTPEPAHSSNSSRKHMHIAHFLTPPNQDTATSASRESSISRITEPCIATSIEAANNSAAEALQCVAIGIAETMNFAFPQAGFTSAMTVPQSLRRQLSAIIRTFVLPTSALEINLTAEMVSEAQVYVEGGDMAFGTLDAIKNHVVELLYANVYIRLYQEVG
ncbi:hypothetical protein IW140_000259 [Coemansia sp. RSA 1813]|nr:hypothetical protein EV178_000462 [Coemansia sp. RSA 1646]KAJ2093730.1 hypothetical protein IW138_000126 [Coemansia sp. RSA 986]KAJ2573216.1 hypothetical protein IW140_000259 [Coemansia sp. RSA 1813]